MRRSWTIDDCVGQVLAIQSQEPAAPYVALWNRCEEFDANAADEAWTSGSLVKSTQMRVTLHTTRRADYPMTQVMMQSRLRARMNDRRFIESGYTVEQVDDLVPRLLDRLDTPKSTAEVESILGDVLGAPAHPGVWWAVKQFAPIIHAPTGATWTFGHRPAFMAGPVGDEPPTGQESTAAFCLRFLRSFGPASRKDLGQFTMLTQTTIVEALESVQDSLVEHAGPGGEVFYDTADGVLADAEAPARPRLMSMWDSVLLAYADRSRIVPEDYRSTVIRRNGDVLPTLLVDGFVAGVWRAVDGRVEAKAFRHLSEPEWAGLEAEAAALTPLLERDPSLFGRYRRWWPQIDSVESRALSG